MKSALLLLVVLLECTSIGRCLAFVNTFNHVRPKEHRFAPRHSQTKVSASTTTEDALVLSTSGTDSSGKSDSSKTKIVLVAGFESFNRDLYYQAAKELDDKIELLVFADSDIRIPKVTTLDDENDLGINPDFSRAVLSADAVIGSLIFDYDDALAVQQLLPNVKGPRLVFESAAELMEFNQVGSFSMAKNDESQNKPAGAPPAVKAILDMFGSGKEEDKLNGYLKLLKVGPDLLKFVPGEKAADLRVWLEAYRYWNQGGLQNVQAMLQMISEQCRSTKSSTKNIDFDALPQLQVTPDVGLIHPLRYVEASQDSNIQRYFESPSRYLEWRLSTTPGGIQDIAHAQHFHLAPNDGPRAALLLYRKHVVTDQRYLLDLIRQIEKDGIIPIPIFINGVEAHTIVRDLLTSHHEQGLVQQGKLQRDGTYRPDQAVSVDAIVNTIGFPLVGGPAGSMQAGRNVAVAEELLSSMNVPYIVASPLLLQSISQWKQNGVLGLQSIVLYSLPELDGAIDSVVLGGLVGDKIALVPERVRKLNRRVKKWISLRSKPNSDKKVAISLYGFPPNVGAVGTAALLDVPKSLDVLLQSLATEGYDLGQWSADKFACGESLVAALAVLCEDAVISRGTAFMQQAVDSKIARAVAGDEKVAATLALPGGGLGGAQVLAKDVTSSELEEMLGKYMMKKVERKWRPGEIGPGTSADGKFVVSGLSIGNVFIFVQPLLGVEGDPMRLLFDRDLTPHPQYCAAYKWLQTSWERGGFGADAIVHFGMHGTVEWLPGQPLGNDRTSWSDELVGDLPNLYVYAANNPSESILAKRRGYGTIVSYNVPPYGRSGLYLELSNLKELVEEYRIERDSDDANSELFETVVDLARRNGMLSDVPLPVEYACDEVDLTAVPGSVRSDWVSKLSVYLNVLQDRLFSSGLHVLGSSPSTEELVSYLSAYFGERLSERECHEVAKLASQNASSRDDNDSDLISKAIAVVTNVLGGESKEVLDGPLDLAKKEASEIVALLGRSTEEITSLLQGLEGGYIPAAPGGDLLRDGTSVLPTGRNTHALDPYRMPSTSAWVRGQKAAKEIIRQHQENDEGSYPETVAVSLWGLDAIKTRGESIAIVLALVGATPVREGTGRIVRYDLIPIEELGRPRIDVLASLSGIFRDSFANVVDLLDDMFERAAQADENTAMNFIKKHAEELIESGVDDRVAARLFSNPPGDYGSMVNEIVGTGEWEDDKTLGETWRDRNVFSYGRNEGTSEASGTARPEVLDKLLTTTSRVVQEIDSVEYGLSDIQGTVLSLSLD